MSRIGKKPIIIPQNVNVSVEGGSISVKGPRGQLKRVIHPSVGVAVENGLIKVTIDGDSREIGALHGLTRALIANMITGVSKGFERAMEIIGVGYRVEMNGRTAVFNLGYSHPINVPLPEGIDAKAEKTKLLLSGADKELLGKTAAYVRGLRPPEPYKGKGIKYADETIRRKAGKTGAK
ncbi:MAG: 50S ribosomal protein L6 [Deltaproteobacteria bacterium CG_4_8_14_3_um_filter_51_11]|nr:50S ribosomal protein L6 [bacterium]OIP39426.1 MAG: 50S ribosomal protein L6 [Desulfobacteraceae bacterium CG2_30_51_40]PIP45307.1 MAG: 50S ribosomal protein L6 [Deltaproteobacteria bacterium CG23_combo_of_CG06-09_8_20_14_all_51_20]PIW02161.1 MAG: 50S ribosomal protein L6 [Deltaproteobacteria bacterium CG17_big_fil_post_rev_8_21_14_2_50_51_6]PIX21057.1 MAG: 50S ribosomal protein L6 [Deltaproteobacteria bacterium CG_4_8_14_3_um_filter_51_11]PIY22940.1 MAG: 50S ribosomal protein L6 [Deltaprot